MEFTHGDNTFTLRPAPVREPPFDDELAQDRTDHPGPMQPALPFPPLHPPVRHRSALAARSARRTAAGDPAACARRLLIGIIEAAAHRRPLHQISGLVSPSVALDLRRDLVPVPGTRGEHWLRRARVASLRSSEPTDGIAELCATLRTPSQVRAAALRLEIRRGQWICTRLMFG